VTHRLPESQPDLLVAAHTDGTIRPAGLEITVVSEQDLVLLLIELDSDPTVPEQAMLQDLFAPTSRSVLKSGCGVIFRDVTAGEPLVVFARALPDAVPVKADQVQAVLRCTARSSDGRQTWTSRADTGTVQGQWR
jgi:hypothetical protein